MEYSYFEDKMREINEGFNEVNVNGCKLLQNRFTDDLLKKYERDIKDVDDDKSVSLCGEYFIFRWLFEEEHFDYVNQGIKNIYCKTNKKATLRNKVSLLFTSDWRMNECAAFEIALMIRFFNEGKLDDIDAKLSSETNTNADFALRVTGRIILVEATTINHGIKELPTGAFAVPLSRNEKTLQLKIKRKVQDQLSKSHYPIILAFPLLHDENIDQIQVSWRIKAIAIEYPEVSGLIVCDNVYAQSGVFYTFPNATMPLNEEENTFFTSIMKPNVKFLDFFTKFMTENNVYFPGHST